MVTSNPVSNASVADSSLLIKKARAQNPAYYTRLSHFFKKFFQNYI